MNLNKYQTAAFSTARIDWNSKKKRHIPSLGVIGELGSLASEIKKGLRDGEAYTESAPNVCEEFGDVIWYLGALASRHGLKLGKLRTEYKSRLQKRSEYSHIYDMVHVFAELAAAIESAQGDDSSARQELAERIGAALSATLQAIEREKLELGVILKANLSKVQGMFGASELGPAPCLDAKFPGYERLPRSIAIHFLERSRGPERLEVVLRVNDLNIGDRLTDNAKEDDGYRYHDAFHLAYAAVLGWSPVVRATFRLKRKSDGAIDEVQDGARAAIVEEAISQTVFNYARGHSMLAGLDRIDHGLLKFIQRMVRGLEVQDCSMNEWQQAIFTGFSAFRELKKNRGGWLILNAETRSLSYNRNGPVDG